MRFTLFTIVASLSASAVHGSTVGSGSLVTRAGPKPMSDSHNATSGNGSSIGTMTNSSSVNGSHGSNKKSKSDHKTHLPSSNTTSGNGSSIGSSHNATSGDNDKDDDDLPGSSNSTGNGTKNPLLAPLPKNATTDQKIARLEAKLADHKQKLERTESKLVIEKQKLIKLGGGNHTGNASAPIHLGGGNHTTNASAPITVGGGNHTSNTSSPIVPHPATKANASGSSTKPSKKNPLN